MIGKIEVMKFVTVSKINSSNIAGLIGWINSLLFDYRLKVTLEFIGFAANN